MSGQALSLLWFAAYMSALTLWSWAPMVKFLPTSRLDWMMTARREIHPFLPAMIVVDLTKDVWGRPVLDGTLSYVLSVLMLFLWATSKDDDDRWKRRRRKLSAKVAQSGSRLVVVPAGVEK